MSRALIVTLGSEEDRICWGHTRTGWVAYAAAHGATVLEHEARAGERDPARIAERALASHQGFDQALLIDPWIRVSSSAPCVFDSVANGAAPLDSRFGSLWVHERRTRFPFLAFCPGHSYAPRCIGMALEAASFLNFAGREQDLSIEPEPWSPAESEEPPPPGATMEAPAVRAVALFIYRRPDLTARVFDAIRSARPQRLFLLADGPDPRRAEDAVLCERARQSVSNIDWPCEVFRDFAPEHLGLRRSVESGFRFVFERVEEVIFLEDDTVPSSDFFRFCEELLERYRDDERVLSIGGSALHFGLMNMKTTESHMFSRYPVSWGWATWKRAIRRYDPSKRHPEAFTDTLSWLRLHLGAPQAAAYWSHLFESRSPDTPSWDYIWARSGFLADGLHVVPTRNLISNIGFRPDATHTRQDSPVANLPLEPLDFPLGTSRVVRSEDLDAFLEETRYSGNLTRALSRVRQEVKGHQTGTLSGPREVQG